MRSGSEYPAVAVPPPRRAVVECLQRVDGTIASSWALANHGRPSSFTASSTASRYVTDIPLVNVEPPADTDDPQPDGYLTEERKQADPDHGFSTFFSETGAFFLVRTAAENM